MGKWVPSKEVLKPFFKLKSLTNLTAASNLLKALGPNDDLVGAVDDLDRLLKIETPIIVTQINKKVSAMDKIVQETARVGNQINERTTETHKCITSQTAMVRTISDRTLEVQKSVKEASAHVAQYSRQLSVSMDRMQGMSTSSQASIEELTEKVDSILSSIQGSIPLAPFLRLHRQDLERRTSGASRMARSCRIL
jgi:methyl-accepting chemotaxis protein